MQHESGTALNRRDSQVKCVTFKLKEEDRSTCELPSLLLLVSVAGPFGFS